MKGIWAGIVLLMVSMLSVADGYDNLKVLDSALSSGAKQPFPLFNGEHIDFRTASAYWEIPGPSIPGQGGMDINVNFSFNKLRRGTYLTLGSWELELPRIEIQTSPAAGHVRGSYRNAGNVCGDPTTLIDEVFITTAGKPTHMRLVLPGQPPQQILQKEVSGTSYPTSAKFVTSQNYIISCSTDGDTFIVKSPDGITYKLNVLSSLMGAASNWAKFGTWRFFPGTLVVYPSSVTDLWGNKLSYSYVSSTLPDYPPELHNRKLISKIRSNDGRVVSFFHSSEANPKLERISVNGRDWKFVYEAASTRGKYLDAIVLPNGSKWSFVYDKSSTNDGSYAAAIAPFPPERGKDTSSKNLYALKEVKSPWGGKVTYTYGRVPNNYFGIGRISNPYMPIINTRTVSGPEISTHKSTFVVSKRENDSISRTKITSGSRVDLLDFHRTGWSYGLLADHVVLESGEQILKKDYGWVRGAKIGKTGLKDEHESLWYLRSPFLVTTTIDGMTLETFYMDHDFFGNPKTIREYGTRLRTTRNTYDNNTSDWTIGNLKSSTVSGVSDKLEYTYEKGKLKTVTKNGLKKTFYYHSNGNLSEVGWYVGGVLVKESYSDYFRGVPRKITNADGFSTTFTVDYFGNIRKVTDPEGYATWYEYDSLNRLSKEIIPGQSDTIYTWQSMNQRNTSKGNLRVIERFNALGQLKYKKSWDTKYPSEPIIQMTEYNSRGLVSFTSLPSDSEGDTKGYRREYDAIDRIEKVTNTVTGKHKTYIYGLPTLGGGPVESLGFSMVDERGFHSLLQFDVYGSPGEAYLRTIHQETSSSDPKNGVTTIYERNKKGVITSITQGGITETYSLKPGTQYVENITRPERVTSFTIDEMGRVTEKWYNSYRYERATYDYSPAGRLNYIDYPIGTHDVIFDYYDNGDLKRARRVRNYKYPTNALSDWNYKYYPDGNLKSETLKIDGESYSLVYDYTDHGNLDTIIYPSGQKVGLSTDALGRNRALFNQYASTPNRNLITDVTFHPTGNMHKITYANGATQTQRVDAQLRTDRITVPGKVDLEYKFDEVGNVKSITDYLSARRVDSFTYDGLNRLKTAKGPWGSYTYNYSESGNITSRTRANGNTLDYNYNSASNRLQSVSGDLNYSFQYDSRGNVKYNSRHHFIYDFANNALGMGKTSAANDWLYEYDAHDRRIVNFSGRGEYYSLYNLAGQLMFEVDKNNNYSEYYYLNGQMMVRRDNCESFSDAQGNCRVKIEWILPAITMLLN